MDERQASPRVVAVKWPAIVAVPAPLVIREIRANTAKYSAKRRDKITCILLHATHGAEGAQKAEDEALASAKPLFPGERAVSAHYFVDSNSIVRSVPDILTAWHAGHNANLCSIGVEICGSADQSRTDWFDAVSLPTLNLAAGLVAHLCMVFHLPPVLIDANGLRMRQLGVSTHSIASQAWHDSDHYDPGPNFPLNEFMRAVTVAVDKEPVGKVL